MAPARRLLGILVLLGMMATDAAPYDSSESEDRSVEDAIAQLHSQSKENRRSAVARLAQIESERATEGLIAALDDSSVSEAAVAALARRSHDRSLARRSIEGLIHALDDRGARVRRSAVSGLAEVETRRSTEGLIHALDSSDVEVERTAVTALAGRAHGSLSEDRATEGLIHALDSGEPVVRRRAVDGLRAVDSERARQGLERAAAASAR
jgi:HEAT repeat protein